MFYFDVVQVFQVILIGMFQIENLTEPYCVNPKTMSTQPEQQVAPHLLGPVQRWWAGCQGS